MAKKRTLTDRAIGRLRMKPVPTGNNFVLPNNSGEHQKGIKRNEPVNDVDLVNKKYVDDNLSLKLEQHLGSESSGVNGAANRVLTLTNTTVGVFLIFVDNQMLSQNFGFTISGQDVTFLINLYNKQLIDLFYV